VFSLRTSPENHSPKRCLVSVGNEARSVSPVIAVEADVDRTLAVPATNYVAAALPDEKRHGAESVSCSSCLIREPATDWGP
jgi:hypothetical protein